jgi:pimeloyl-ACP methyl ester carboxylesterase
MPFARLSGADIYYEVVGGEGPWVALVSGGRAPLADLAGLARAIADRGYRVLLHDRRSCGRSSLDFDSLQPEEELWADDLAELLDQLDATPAVIGGRSRGARVALHFALRHPGDATALLLWGISGGPLAVRFLDWLYFAKCLSAARAGGMEAVSATDPFIAMLEDDPSKREQLLALDPATFIATMERRRAEFLQSAECPVMGFTDDDLRAVTAPTLIVPYYDRAHPDQTIRHAARTIPNGRLVDFAPARRVGQDGHGSVELAAADEPVIADILDSFIAELDARRDAGVGVDRRRTGRRRWRLRLSRCP